MWILFGAKTKSKVVEGGRRGERACPDCEKPTTWVECDVKDSFNVFFVDLIDTKSRCMRCTECGEDCSIEQWDAEQRRVAKAISAPAATPSSAAQPAAKRPAEVDVDAEFAALKTRLKKS